MMAAKPTADVLDITFPWGPQSYYWFWSPFTFLMNRKKPKLNTEILGFAGQDITICQWWADHLQLYLPISMAEANWYSKNGWENTEIGALSSTIILQWFNQNTFV